MNLVRCSKGHYYDADKSAGCPHCNEQPSDSVTIAMVSSGSLPTGADSEPVTVARTADSDPVTVSRTVSETAVMEDGYIPAVLPGDDGVTVSYYANKLSEPIQAEPVVGWLVCTAGTHFGESFNLKSGRNFIGRSAQMDVCLDGDTTVSRDRHAVVIYEPVERMFLAQAGDSRELFYVNDSVVLENVQLKPYDVISVGTVNLMLIPCCGKSFAWEDLEK